MTGLLILGAGGHGLIVADAARECGRWREIAFLDDERREHPSTDTWPVIGCRTDINKFRYRFSDVAVAIGDNRLRLELAERLIGEGYHLPVIIHPTAYVSRQARVGEATVVLAQSVVNPASQLGRACIVNTAASVDHDCVVGDGVHISPGARVAGHVSIGHCSWLGVGSSVCDGLNIGRNVTLGAGAVAIRDLPDEVTAVGVPAAAIRGAAR